eukprot:jgi/Hompol1/3438/HPOL_006530-RA
MSNHAVSHVAISIRRSPGQSEMLHWLGFVLDSVLFVKLPPASSWASDANSFKDSIHALLEFAESSLHCTSVVACVDKSLRILPAVMRLFNTAGFELVHPSVYSFGDEHILFGFEI